MNSELGIGRNKPRFRLQDGQIIIEALVLSVIAAVVVPILIGVSINNLNEGVRAQQSEIAFQIAEAGIEYYRWHLAHDATDFQDGTGSSGPYVHTYFARDGDILGNFSLSITPPPIGSTVVTVMSTGTASGTPLAVRVVEAQFAIPSFAKYAVVVNDNIRFGPGTNVFGEIHSNQGIRFDGVANGPVTSALSEYDDPDHSGGDEFGVHTHVAPVDPLPPAAVPNRSDVFQAGRQFPVPAVDFDGLTADLAQIKADAQSAGYYFAPSGAFGYRVVLRVDDTFDLYRVDSIESPPWGCSNVLNQDGWGTWTINNETLLGNYSNPGNGLIFVEDDVWVSGQINSARLTIAAGEFPDNPSTRRSITVNNDVMYTNYDGTDAIAMIAQKNFNVGWNSEDDMRIDGAIIAQNGRVGRYYYRPPWWIFPRCSPHHNKGTITLFGMIGTNQRYGFAYTDNTGYATRNLNYDAGLLYSPPPSFPLTSELYETILWEEVR